MIHALPLRPQRQFLTKNRSVLQLCYIRGKTIDFFLRGDYDNRRIRKVRNLAEACPKQGER